MLKPAVGGLFVGLMALAVPQIMAGGYGWIQKAINGDAQMTLSLMLVLCFAKIVATSLTISSGGSGGVFAPSLFIGAMLGGAFGKICHAFAPGIVDKPEAFVLVGMGGFFAGVAKVPITAMIMVSEMSGSYGLLVPLMLVSIVNVAILSSKCTLYEEQVPSLVDSPAHQGDFVVDVLEQLHVREVMDTSREYDLIPQEMPLPQVLRVAANSNNMYFPVIDKNRTLVGIFSLRDLRAVLTGEGAGGLVLAVDICSSPVLTVNPEDDLHAVLRKLTQKNIEELPVVEASNTSQVIGVLSRKDVIGAYHRRIGEVRNDRAEENGHT
jgi:CIC family chloride channel protein